MPVRIAEPAASAYRYPLLIKQLLHTPLATAPDQEIVYRDERRHSYREFSLRLARLANGLQMLGVEAGSTVAVLDWDSHRYLECFFAVPMLGAVLQTVNVRLGAEQLHYTLSHAGAGVILVHRDFLPLVDAMRPKLPRARHFVLLEDRGAAGPRPDWIAAEYETLLAGVSNTFEFPDFDENAVATTFYTTGTTGEPKGVCFSHRQIVLHTLAITAALASPAHGQSCRLGDVYMPLTPLFHVHAWGMPYFATLLGMKQVYPGRFVPEDALALREREGVTYSHCVPTILQMLLEAAERRGASLRGWKICIGGSALPGGLARAALAHGIDVFAGYGMSETAPVLTLTRLEEAAATPPSDAELQRRCRTGLPIPLVDLRLVDPDGREVPRDGRSVGEVAVRAPWATVCYVGNAEASDALWRGGYLHTQDVARIDTEGFVQITDRMKDVIKSGGEWISSLELESLISRHPGVAEVAVVAVPDERWGERPHAIVVPKPEWRARLAADDVREHVAALAAAGKVAGYAVPERVTLVESLPKTSVGKINKRALRDLRS
jgi:fatty-acyl-CoA synthase